jgi:hypothetical protein
MSLHAINKLVHFHTIDGKFLIHISELLLP